MPRTIESANSQSRTQGEQRDFERMMTQTRRRAYVMALQLTRSATEAEDLVQETFVKAWRGFGQYTPGRPFLNWLLRIMQRAYLDSLRRDNPIRKADLFSALTATADGESQELWKPDDSPGPDDFLERKDFSESLRVAMEKLPEPYRKAIELCDLEDMSYSDIAREQGTTVGTVRSRIHRGRKILREIVLRKLSEP